LPPRTIHSFSSDRSPTLRHRFVEISSLLRQPRHAALRSRGPELPLSPQSLASRGAAERLRRRMARSNLCVCSAR
jgi:hypothetical protein